MSPLNLVSALDLIRHHYRRLFLWGLVVAVFGYLVSFVIPPTYRATAVILPPEEDELTATLSMTRRSLGNLGALGRLGGSYFTQADIALSILNSRRVREAVVETLNLEEVYKSKSLEAAQNKLKSRVKIRMSTTGTVSVAAEDGDRERAAQIANQFIDELDHFNQEFRSFRARRTRQFLEQRVAESDSLLRDAEEALAEYQREEGSVVIPPEAQGSLSAAASLMAEKVAAEIELELLRQYASPYSEEVQRQEARVRELRRQVGSLPTTQVGGSRMLREVAVQQQLFVLLTGQLEQARIREAMDTPTVQVLDEAVPPVKRSWPRRGLIAAFALLIGLIIGYADSMGKLPQPFRKK